MKLLFAIKRLNGAIGGAERVMCTICSALVERGHDVTVVTFDHPNGEAFYSLDTRIKRIDLGIGDSSKRAGLWETLRRVFALRRTIIAEQPEVVVGFMHSMFVPLGFAMMGSGIPVVASEHIVPAHYRRRPLQFGLLMLSSWCLSKITVLSEAIRVSYPSMVARKMVVMPNPVMRADGRANPAELKQQYVLLNIGRMDAQKDQSTLIRAFSRLANKYPEWHLRIIGEGELRPQLTQLIMQLGLQKRIEMPGVTDKISSEYCAADIFVISSRYEAFGLVTAEAMSYGLPVVGFADCPGTNELILNNECGMLIQAGEDRAAALANGLESLMQDADQREKLGVQGIQSIDQRYAISRVCDQWESLLAAVVVKPPIADGARR